MKVINVKDFFGIPDDFTGICIVEISSFIVLYKNGHVHRKDGPAATNMHIITKYWYYKGARYGLDDAFTNKTWKEKVKKLKREKELKIFK